MFEAARLALVLVAVSGLGGSSGPSCSTAFAAPQSLFLLLALFSWVDPDRYDAYRPLFAAGKFISAAALGLWLITSFPSLVRTLSINDLRFLTALAGAAVVAAYDLLSGALTAFSVFRTPAATDAAEDLPALVVDEVADEVGGS